MIKEQDIKDLYQVTGFLGGLSVLLDDIFNQQSETSKQIEDVRVSLANIIYNLEKEYESERGD